MRLAKAEVDSVRRKRIVTFFSRESLFLRGGDDSSVSKKSGGTVMIERGNSKQVPITQASLPARLAILIRRKLSLAGKPASGVDKVGEKVNLAA